MSDYKQTRDAAGKVTSQYDKMLRNLDDDDLVKQRCDTIDDLTRRHQHALHKIDVLEDRIKELEALYEAAKHDAQEAEVYAEALEAKLYDIAQEELSSNP